MFSSPIKTRLQPARAAFSTKFGMRWHERVDLDDELQPEPFPLAHLDQPVEDRLPIAVAREIVVGDEEAEDALGEVGAHQPLDIVGIAPARFAPLHIDDRAKAALERAAAPGVEGADRLAVAPHDVERQKRGDLLLQPGQIVHVVVDRLQPACERVGEEPGEPSLRPRRRIGSRRAAVPLRGRAAARAASPDSPRREIRRPPPERRRRETAPPDPSRAGTGSIAPRRGRRARHPHS